MIDAHQHFWQLSRGDYDWPNEGVAPIFRDYGPDELAPLLAASSVRRTILVQATDTQAETRYLLDIAARHDTVAGVVGWVDLVAPDAIEAIDRLRADPMLKGLRPMLQSIDDTDWILRRQVRPALAHMASAGLRLDALIQPRHLPALLQVAREHPTLAVVIDHIAKPKMGGGAMPDADWSAGMAALAACPNVWCKLSGMVTEIGPGWRQRDLEPFAQAVLALFGARRTMWGSDWPVVNLASNYAIWINAAQALASRLSEDDRAWLFEKSAASFYGLDPR